jgi:hypothetical protein
MSNSSNDLTVYQQPGVPAPLAPRTDEWLDVKKQIAGDAASALFQVLAEGGSLWMQNEKLKGQTEAEWQRIQGYMAKVDNETRNALQLLEANLKDSKEQTNRLGMLLNSIETMSDEKAKILLPMLTKLAESVVLAPKSGPSA